MTKYTVLGLYSDSGSLQSNTWVEHVEAEDVPTAIVGALMLGDCREPDQILAVFYNHIMSVETAGDLEMAETIWEESEDRFEPEGEPQIVQAMSFTEVLNGLGGITLVVDNKPAPTPAPPAPDVSISELGDKRVFTLWTRKATEWMDDVVDQPKRRGLICVMEKTDAEMVIGCMEDEGIVVFRNDRPTPAFVYQDGSTETL